jgi:hypothetical protein
MKSGFDPKIDSDGQQLKNPKKRAFLRKALSALRCRSQFNVLSLWISVQRPAAASEMCDQRNQE